MTKMKNILKVLSTLILLHLGVVGFSQSDAPIHVVQRQLEAYNKQDITKFVAQYADSVKVFSKISDKKPVFVGKQAFEERYATLFKNYPNNYCTLLSRMVQGNFVIDHELITGRGDQERRAVAIYEVKEGKIINCWFLN
jgi:hypothetical protein